MPHTTHDALLLPSGLGGIAYATQAFELVASRLSALFSFLGRRYSPEVLRFPPLISLSVLARSGYLDSFPHLVGAVRFFDDDEDAYREAVRRGNHLQEWVARSVPSDVALLPAACYPLYPLIAARGGLICGRQTFDVFGQCFRHERTHEPTRLQSFRMQELVCIGSEPEVVQFRQEWLLTAKSLFQRLELPFTIELAHDPFFGRSGNLLAAMQEEHALKYEVLVPINDGAAATACFSLNYHRDHFGQTWQLLTAPATQAHTSCIAMGLERLSLALFKVHGPQITAWPGRLRSLFTDPPGQAVADFAERI